MFQSCKVVYAVHGQISCTGGKYTQHLIVEKGGKKALWMDIHAVLTIAHMEGVIFDLGSKYLSGFHFFLNINVPQFISYSQNIA